MPELSIAAMVAIGFRGARQDAWGQPPFYSACEGSMQLQSGSGILTPG